MSTLGTEEKRTGALVLDENNKEIARNEKCPGVHGEAAAKDEAIGIGCEDGILIYKDGKFTKIDAPDDYGRIGNQAGSDASPVLLGDYKTDPEARTARGVLGTDGALHVIDPDTGKIEKKIPVVGEWQEPLDWQQARPTLFVRDHTAYVSEPGKKALHAIDLETGEKTASVTLPQSTNELSGVVAGH